MTTARLMADQLVGTAAESAALAALREVTGEVDGAMERHCGRTFVVAERLAGGPRCDREALLCAALLHDIGAYPAASRGGVYVTDGRAFAERLLGALLADFLRERPQTLPRIFVAG